MNSDNKALFLKVIDFLNGMIRLESGAIKTEYGMMQIGNEWVTFHSADIENMVESIQRCIGLEKPTMDMFKEKEFEICDEEEEEEAEEVVKQLPDGEVIYTCDDCPHCIEMFEPDITLEEAVEDGLTEEYYGMVGGCGCGPETFFECQHPDNKRTELADKYEMCETCPLEDGPEEEEDEYHENIKMDDCDCDGEGCEDCCCEDCGKPLYMGEGRKCGYCIERLKEEDE